MAQRFRQIRDKCQEYSRDCLVYTKKLAVTVLHVPTSLGRGGWDQRPEQRDHLREKRTTLKISSTCACKSRPDSGLDCLICSSLLEQRPRLPERIGRKLEGMDIGWKDRASVGRIRCKLEGSGVSWKDRIGHRLERSLGCHFPPGLTDLPGQWL